jgi:hypothetical protein
VNTAYPLRFEAAGRVAGLPAAVFEHLDDPHRLSRHMEQRSMGMMGTSMSITTDAQGGRKVGSVIRMEGRVLGIALRLAEAVTEREPPVSKAWETLGEPQLLVIGAYRMGFRIGPAEGGSRLAVSIAYALPTRPLQRLAGMLLAALYARWCCRRMLRDAQAAFAAGAPPSARPAPPA